MTFSLLIKRSSFAQVLSQLFGILLAGMTLFLFYVTFFQKEWIEVMIKWFEINIELWGSWNYLVAGISSLLESFPVIGVFVPGRTIMIFVGGFFGALSSVHLLTMLLVAIVGAVLGNFIGYVLGQKYGLTFFDKYGEWVGIGPTELKYLQKAITKKGPWFLILGKFHGTTRAFVPFIAGAMQMRAVTFWTWNIIGSIIWAVTMITIGVVFAEFWESIIDNAGKIGLMTIALLGGYIYFFQREGFMQYLRDKQVEVRQGASSK